MDYLIVVDASAARIADDCFVTESAFAKHLRELRAATASQFDRLVLVAPTHEPTPADRDANGLGRITAGESIVLLPLHEVPGSTLRFLLRDLPRLLASLWTATAKAGIVHTGLSMNVLRPTAFIAMLIGVLRRKTVVHVTDIDFRESPSRLLHLGIWSRRSYLMAHWIYDPLRVFQIWLAVRTCPLVLMKSCRMMRDFGKGRSNVRAFFDTVHNDDSLAGEPEMSARLARLTDDDHPLRLVYFGRLVRYKGIDRSIRAVHRAIAMTGRPLELHIIGDGECRPELSRLVDELELGPRVHFHPPVPYGPQLFALLREMDIHIATPLTEDTPRASFDAMAAGIPILAFDLSYYRDLAELTPAVVTSPWMDIEALARALADLNSGRTLLGAMSTGALEFARSNTQDIWLRRRVEWTNEVVAPVDRSPKRADVRP